MFIIPTLTAKADLNSSLEWDAMSVGPKSGSSSGLSGVGSNLESCNVSTVNTSSPDREPELPVLPILNEEDRDLSLGLLILHKGETCFEYSNTNNSGERAL